MVSESVSGPPRLNGTAATRILMLHRVQPDTKAAFGLPDCYRMRGTSLTVEELARITDLGGPFISLAAVEQALSEGQPLPLGTVLTFDDGYREHLDVVTPMLAERDISATFYIATGLHGDGSRVAAVDAWYWLLDHAVVSMAVVPLPDGSLYRGRVDTMQSKSEWIGGPPKQALLSAAPDQQGRMLLALEEALGVALPRDLASELYLRPTEWRALMRSGMRVGAHSVLHPRLTQIESAEQRQEVQESVDMIRAVDTPVAFAYPDGAYDSDVVDVLRDVGVSSAVTCESAAVGCSADPLRLPRMFATPAFVARL